MNEPTLTPEEVVPVPVPIAGSASTHIAPPVPSSDQLPTVRFQSLPPPLPPPRAPVPVAPAQKTQPLRPITRDAALAAAGEARTSPWRAGAAFEAVRRAVAIVLSPLRELRSASWTARRVGISSAASGVMMIMVSLVVGWDGVASVRYEKTELASLAIAVLLARTVLAVAAMAVGYGLLRVGERTLRLRSDPATSGR